MFLLSQFILPDTYTLKLFCLSNNFFPVCDGNSEFNLMFFYSSVFDVNVFFLNITLYQKVFNSYILFFWHKTCFLLFIYFSHRLSYHMLMSIRQIRFSMFFMFFPSHHSNLQSFSNNFFHSILQNYLAFYTEVEWIFFIK